MTHDDVVLKVQTLAPILHAHHFSNHIWNMSTVQGKNANDNIYITEPSKEHIIYESKPIKLDGISFADKYPKYIIDYLHTAIVINSQDAFNKNNLEIFKNLISLSQIEYDMIHHMFKMNDYVNILDNFMDKAALIRGLTYNNVQNIKQAFNNIVEIDSTFNDKKITDLDVIFEHYKAYSIIFEIKNSSEDVTRKDDILIRLKELKNKFQIKGKHISKAVLVGNKNIFNEKDKIYFNTETDIFFNFIEDIECGIYV